ncbi:RHS repeat-associated core domain-containing protein [Microbacterium sp. NPDC089696]|uniref:RHS repeat-associated core domain-containing protein n=1 Tax=Microbacterium sp. NPDC089696 TaxID=3364199 RepID=UPI00380FA7DC
MATGNLRVTNQSLSLVGVTGQVSIAQSYNSLSAVPGSGSVPAANRWTTGIQGVGYLAAAYGSSGIIYTAGDGTTWLYAAATGGGYTAPAGAKADLAPVAGGGFTLTERESRQVATFNADGQLTTIADRNGNATTIGYASPGNPNSVVSSAGPVAARTATLAYSSSTRTLTATQTSGSSTRTLSWVKDSSSNLTSIVDAEGKTTAFGYTGQQLTTITGPTGAVVTIGYESASSSRVTSVSQANTTAGSPGASVTRFAYPTATTRFVARGNTNQSTAVASVPHVTFTIDSSTNLVSASTDEMGRQKGATYTPNGDVATSTSGTGSTAGTSTATYGANNGDSMTSLQAPGGSTTSAAYANTAAATAYLASSSTDSAGNTSTYTYNGAGNALTSSNALAATATLTYNADGTVATALAPGNGTNSTVYGYNANKQLTSMTPVTGSSLGARAFTYDDFGRLRTATDGRGTTTTYTYDKLDRLLSTAFSDSTPTVTNTYTNRGLPATRVDGNGTTTYTYDQLGRLIARGNTFYGGTITYGYDKSSNLTTVTDGRGTTVNSFDDAGVPTKITYNKDSGTQVLEFAVDDQGRRTDSWLQSNPTHTTYRAHTHLDYDTTGRVSRSIAEMKDGSSAGTVTTVFDTSYCYNTSSAAPTCGTTTANDRSKLQWSRDNLTGQVTAYGYDTAGRLLTATQSGGTNPSTYTYTYDARGNRLTATVTGAGASTQSLTFNAANQVTNTGFTYDGTGNLTKDNVNGIYTYNGAQQMTGVSNATGTFTYKYAGTSQVEVLQQEDNSRNYKLVYGRTNQVGLPVIEQVQAGNSRAYIENDPVTGEPLMLRSSSGIETLYVYDGLGSPVALLTDFASQSYAYNFDPYGTAVLTAGGTGNGAVENPFLFKGGIQDRATGWVHYGNRWYNPTLGRWTQQDTLDTPLDPNNANRYAYAGADPVNNVDPSGRAIGLPCAIGVLAGLGIISLGVSELAGDTLASVAGAVPSFGGSLIAGGALAVGIAAEIAFGVYVAASAFRECIR